MYPHPEVRSDAPQRRRTDGSRQQWYQHRFYTMPTKDNNISCLSIVEKKKFISIYLFHAQYLLLLFLQIRNYGQKHLRRA